MTAQSLTVDAEDHRAARAVAVSASAMILAKIVHLGLNVVTSLALIRYLGPAEYGDYVFVLSFCALFGLISDFGITKVAVRDISRRPEQAAAILGTSMLARLAIAVVAWFAAQGVLEIMQARVDLRYAVAVALLVSVTEALLSVVAVFQLRLAMQYEAFISVVAQAIDTVLIFWLIWRGSGLLGLVAAPVLSGLLGALLAIYLARSRFDATVAFDRRLLRPLVANALPVGLTVLLAVTYLKLDGVLLGMMATREDVGLYGAAQKPVEYLLLASVVILLPIFPLLSRLVVTDPVRFRQVYHRGSQAILCLTLPIPVGLFFLGQSVVDTLYDSAFSASAQPLFVLAVALVAMVFNGLQGFTLLAGNHQRLTLAYDAIGLLANVIANLILIPKMGYLGAAIAALVTSIVVLVCASIATYRVMGVAFEPVMLSRVVLANCLFGLVLWTLLAVEFPWIFAGFVAAIAYPLWLLLARATSVGELQAMLVTRTAEPSPTSV